MNSISSNSLGFEIITCNVNGLNEKQKRKDVFGYLRELRNDIYLLQETHLTEELENYIRAEWGYELWVAGRETNKKGVAIQCAAQSALADAPKKSVLTRKLFIISADKYSGK